MQPQEIDYIFQKLKESKKYKYLCEDTLYRISNWALNRFKGKIAVKAAKKKLHQVYGAYLETFHPALIQKLLDKIALEPDIEKVKTIALEIMTSHTSTSERIPFLNHFYNDLFKQISKPKKILDLACGLHPLAVLWMNLEPGTEYYAYDIDTRLVTLLNVFFSYLHPGYKAECTDILNSIPGIKADVVFLLKTLPCLEQQEKGISEKLIASLQAKYIIISFPLKTLTGKEIGMQTYYQQHAREFLQRLNLQYWSLTYSNEICFVINKNSPPHPISRLKH